MEFNSPDRNITLYKFGTAKVQNCGSAACSSGTFKVEHCKVIAYKMNFMYITVSLQACFEFTWLNP